eukprot:jgi/Tetstr1/447780/TSEL_035110.t1
MRDTAHDAATAAVRAVLHAFDLPRLSLKHETAQPEPMSPLPAALVQPEPVPPPPAAPTQPELVPPPPAAPAPPPPTPAQPEPEPVPAATSSAPAAIPPPAISPAPPPPTRPRPPETEDYAPYRSFKQLKRVLRRYLKGTPGLCITYIRGH